ncbi:MAG: hypothetical protein ACFCUJ_02420 [Thiotrichales bacterium]
MLPIPFCANDAPPASAVSSGRARKSGLKFLLKSQQLKPPDEAVDRESPGGGLFFALDIPLPLECAITVRPPWMFLLPACPSAKTSQ